VTAKHAVITAHRDEYDVRVMCAALGVSVSGYYAAQRRAPSERRTTEERLRVQVRATYAASRRRYGAPRVHRELQAQGTRVAKKRVARMMREEGLVARPRRRFVRTTDSAHSAPVPANVLARQFAVPDVAGLDHVWVSDITYIPTREGWLYLAVVLDLASRRVVGWAMRDSLAEALALDALQMALDYRRPSVDLLHHSDRGSQYAGSAYRALLASHNLRCSMSRRGNCWDNAVAESFFATLEHELLADNDFASHRAARGAIFEFIEVWYNRERRHSSLGYVSPVHYEQAMTAA
jgi:transposase InsO family protein